MKAVMYGGGNIGRGFIGALLSQSGYEVTFIDVAEPVVRALSEQHEYPVRYVSNEGYHDEIIRNVTAVNGNDQEKASEAIASCDLMATAVGARILPCIADNIVAGLRKRWSRTEASLNILICENLMDANKVMEKLLKERLSEQERVVFDQRVGLVEASIGRMVPVQTEEMKAGSPLRVCVEEYKYLPTDKAAFRGDIPALPNMIPYEPFEFFIKRKLYLHNMGHAVCAYLGDYAGLAYIDQAISSPEIRTIVHNAMMESAVALSRKYGVALDGLLLHIQDLLYRFSNAALHDTCDRVGRDAGRKLSPEDRLVGAAMMAQSAGMSPVYITLGIAAGLRRYFQESHTEEVSVNAAARALEDITPLNIQQTLTSQTLEFYAMMLDGKSLTELVVRADQLAASFRKDVI